MLCFGENVFLHTMVRLKQQPCGRDPVGTCLADIEEGVQRPHEYFGTGGTAAALADRREQQRVSRRYALVC